MRYLPAMPAMATIVACFLVTSARAQESRPPDRRATDDRDRIEQVMRAREDVLGEAALKRPDGPSYEYFRDLMPPLRYVDANFKHYPIVLSAPGATAKGRLVSNGSSTNALARS